MHHSYNKTNMSCPFYEPTNSGRQKYCRLVENNFNCLKCSFATCRKNLVSVTVCECMLHGGPSYAMWSKALFAKQIYISNKTFFKRILSKPQSQPEGKKKQNKNISLQFLTNLQQIGLQFELNFGIQVTIEDLSKYCYSFSKISR